jgi:hypothetical protein
MKLLYAHNSSFKNTGLLQDLNAYQQVYKIDNDGWCVDRTQSITFPVGETLLDTYKIPNLSNYSFKEACEQQANSILDLNVPVYIMWSGGIDSTALLVSFLSAGRSLENVTVILNYNSIKEYPEFYQQHIRGKLKIAVTDEMMLKMSYGTLDGIILSGEHADQLIGSSNLDAEFLKQPFNYDTFKKFAQLKKFDPLTIDCWYYIYTETMKHSPRPIDTIYDFTWWHGFNFKWQAVALRIYARINTSNQFKTFYSSSAFQSWSVNHTPGSLQKLESKQIILDYTKDQKYFETKRKHPSSSLYFGKLADAAITEQFIKIPHRMFDLKNHYCPDNSIIKFFN